MSSQKLNYYKFFCILFLVLNSALLYRTRILISKNSTLVSESYSLSAEAQSYRSELDSYLVNQSVFNSSSIKVILDNLGVNLSELEDKIVLFIPPFPCGVCVDNEIDFLRSVNDNMSFAVMSPEYRSGDIRIQTRDMEYVSLISYPWDVSGEMSNKPLNQLIYFKVGGDYIYDILLPNIRMKHMSYDYFIGK